MPDSLNYAAQYAQALANAYPYVLHFAALRSSENDSRYRWVNAKTVEVPVLTVNGRVDADRDNIGSFGRNFSNSWETKTLSFHRKWSTLVHPMDIDETNQVASITNITKTFNESQKFPEKDAYLASKVFTDWVAAGGQVDTTVITEANALKLFDDAMDAMDEANVPVTGRIMYVTPELRSIYKRAVNRTIQNGSKAVERSVHDLDEVEIVPVPSKLMKTAYTFYAGTDSNRGYAVASIASQINMLLVHPSCVITPEKYEFAKLDAPAAATEGKYVYFEEDYEDVFLLNQRYKGVFINASIIPVKTVSIAVGTSTSGDTKVTATANVSGNTLAYKKNPAANIIFGTKSTDYSGTSLTSGTQAVVSGCAANDVLEIVEFDSDGLAVAVSYVTLKASDIKA